MRLRWTASGSRIPFVAQLTASECAVACLAMVLAYHGRAVPLRRLRAALGTGRDGANAYALVEAAGDFGLVGRGIRLRAAELHRLDAGAILHWEAKHFVVLERAAGGRVWLLDPARGRRRLSLAEVARSFSGLALAFEPDPAAPVGPASTDEASPAWRILAAAILRPRLLLPLSICAALATSIGIVVALLMSALVARLAAPEPRFADAIGLLVALVLASAATRAWRSRTLHSLGLAAKRELIPAVVGRLVRLPQAYFRQRTVGDLVARVRGLHGVDHSLVSGVGTLVLEGPRVLSYVLTLWWWSPVMLLASALVITAHAVTGAVLRRHVQRYAQDAARVEAELKQFEARLVEQASVLRATGGERAVERWSERQRVATSAADAHARARALDEGVLDGFSVLIPLALLTVGVHEVAAGALSLGAMIGSNCLAVALFRPVAAIMSALGSMASLPEMLDRIDDVLLEPAKPPRPERAVADWPRSIELREVTLGRDEEPVLDSISLTLAALGHLAITGGPGSGKSALAALIAGFERPDRGCVLEDGRPVDGVELRACLVPTTAPLLDGDLFDNVAIGADDPSEEAVVAACRLAGVHDEIDALPLGYRSSVYDGGKAFRAGLRRRVLIARALARRPALLVLDESAASLGAAAEGALVDAILAEGSVRLLVTVTPHRRTIARADRVLILDRGRLLATDDVQLREATGS